MIHFNQDELDGLVETLRGQPGFITAAVVPAGSGDALIERLHEELRKRPLDPRVASGPFGDLEIEVAAPDERPMKLGERAEELGRSRGDSVFILRFDEPETFDSEDEAVRFWSELNYQREALASGTVRTCLFLNEETERGLAMVADDLWDWVTIFRFPEAMQTHVRTPEDSEALVWSDQGRQRQPSENDLAILRSQWQRARHAQLPRATVIENYAVPLFVALPGSSDAETMQLWMRDLRDGDAVASLPPETRLSVAQKMMLLATYDEAGSQREELVQGALAAATTAVADLEVRAESHPEAFEPGLAAALSSSAKLHQDAGRFETSLDLIEKCLELLERVGEAGGGTEAVIKAHRRRRGSLLFLLRARESREPLLEQVQVLREMKEPGLDDESRSKALGSALELSISQLRDAEAGTNAALFASWILSNDSRLEGPRFEEVLLRDPESYFRGIEALWQLTTHTPWERLLIEPLIQQWSSSGPCSATIRENLIGWLLHFSNTGADSQADSDKDQIRAWTSLQWIAVRVLGHRYEPDLLHVFCRYVSSFGNLGEDHWHRPHRAVRHLGFMLRWSFQERVLPQLQEIAADSEANGTEIEAVKYLADELRQVVLPDILRWESRIELPPTEESPSDQLKRGEGEFLLRLSPEEFCDRGPHRGIAVLAGDPEVPGLTREVQQALVDRLQALIRTGRVRDDDGQVTHEGWIFDAWIPWLARGSHRDWWRITTELIEGQIELRKPQWSLMQFPILGIWTRDQPLARKIEERLAAATAPDGEELRENWGLLELLRWALHIEDANALTRCLEALLEDKDYLDICKIEPIPWILRWVLDRSIFEMAGERRRAASQEIERRLWFLVEWSFVHRLTAEESLAWCREVAPLATRWDDLREVLVNQLLETDDHKALEMLLRGGIAELQDGETQRKVVAVAVHRNELDFLVDHYPEFVEGLSLVQKGRFLSEAGRTEELRQWGHSFFSEILGGLPHEVPTGSRLVFTENRRCLHRWAHLEPEAFLRAVKRVAAANESVGLRGRLGAALLEAVLIVWQDLDPLASADAREALDAGSMIHHTWSEGPIPVHVHALWDPEFSPRPEHRALRLRWLRACASDKEVALHSLAARSNGTVAEVESIGKKLLSLDRQLERALGVSLLAWHPEGDRWLEPLIENDPSAWVRQHAEWAVTVCRRDRLGREIYCEALKAGSWLEQQARFEVLVPLILPTFTHWPNGDDELTSLARVLDPRRRALLIDFRYYMSKRAKWNQIVGRNLEKYCRGEDVSTHLDFGEKRPPWQDSRTFDQI